MGPIWGRQDPGGSHVGPMNFVIWGRIVRQFTFLWCSWFTKHIDGSVQDCSIPIANTMDILQSSTKLSIYKSAKKPDHVPRNWNFPHCHHQYQWNTTANPCVLLLAPHMDGQNPDVRDIIDSYRKYVSLGWPDMISTKAEKTQCEVDYRYLTVTFLKIKSEKTPRNSPVRAKYGVSFLSS